MPKLTPPHNLDAEKSILGGILLEPHRMSFVAGKVSTGDFFKLEHQYIYVAMTALHQAGDPIDLVCLTNAVRESGYLDQIGGALYLSELLDFVPTAANINHYCKLVTQASSARKIIEAGRDLVMRAYDGADPETLMGQLANLQTVADNNLVEKNNILTVDQMADIYQEHVRTLDTSRFTTGWPDLDCVIKGVAPGEVMMIIGYSGMFKSAHLHNMLLNGCMRENAKHHLFFSMEMPEPRVFERTVQIACEHYTYNIESGFDHHHGYREKVMDELQQQGIRERFLVCPHSALSAEQIEHYTRTAIAQHGQLGAIGIDYLGLMSHKGTTNEYELISAVSVETKNIAKRLNVPIIVLTQINRASAQDGELEKWSAKGSGAVEASADYMLGLQGSKEKGIQIKLLKNRNGEENVKFDVDIEAKYLKVRGVSPADEQARRNVQRGLGRSRQDKRSAAATTDPY